MSHSPHSLAGPSDSGDSSDSGSSEVPSDSGADATDVISCSLRLAGKQSQIISNLFCLY